jgi:hypothetical protein
MLQESRGKVHVGGRVMMCNGCLTLQQGDSTLSAYVNTAHRHDAVVGLDRAKGKVGGLRLCALTQRIEQCRLQQYKNLSETGDSASTHL